MNASSGFFSKGLDIGFFENVSDDLQKCFQSDNRSDPGSKKRRQNIGTLFKPEPDKMNK